MKRLLFIALLMLSSLFATGCSESLKGVDFQYTLNGNVPYKVQFTSVIPTSDKYGTLNIHWELGDGQQSMEQNPSYTYPGPGKYIVKLRVSSSKQFIDSVTITKEIPIEMDINTDFTYTQDPTNPLLYYFEATAKSSYGELEYEWDFGFGASANGRRAEYIFRDVGEHKVKLITKIKNTDTKEELSKTVNISTEIIGLDFTYSNDLVNPYNIYFVAAASSDKGLIDYEWDFGRGISHKGQNIIYSFDYYGTYVVTLRATVRGTTIVHTVSKEIDIVPQNFENIDFQYIPSDTNPFEIYFETPIISDYGEFEYLWDFGRGDIHTGKSTTYLFEFAQTYSVTLTAKIKNSNIAHSVTKEITINKPTIELDFSYSPSPSNPYEIYLEAIGKTTFSEFIYQWDLGRGEIRSGKNITKIYDTDGKRTVSLTARLKDRDISQTVNKEIEVFPPTIANSDFTYNTLQSSPLTVYFESQGTASYGDLQYEWNFGLGQTSTGKNTTYTFNSLGTYTVTLTTKIKNTNVAAVVTKEITLNKPTIELDFISYPDPANPYLIYFEAQGSTTHGELQYEWNFGMNQVTSGKTASKRYERIGAHQVTLTAKVKNTNIAEVVTKEVTVVPPTIKDAGFIFYADAKNPYRLYFEAQGTASYGDLQYEWDFGANNAGSIYTGKTANLIFSSSGKHSAKLIMRIKGTDIVKEITRDDIFVKKPTIEGADFIWKIDPSKPLDYIFTAYGRASYGNLKYKWNFGTGNIEQGSGSDREVADIKFTKPGIYNVSLTLSIVGNDIFETIERTIVKPLDVDASPKLITSKSGIVFGDVKTGTEVFEVFSVSNTGTMKATNLSISLSDGSQGFSQTNNCSADLFPMSFCTVTVKFKRDTNGKSEGNIKVTADINADKKYESFVSLTAMAVSAKLLVEKQYSNWGSYTFKLTNIGNKTLSFSAEATGSYRLGQSLCGSTLNAGADCYIGVGPDISECVYSGQLHITTDTEPYLHIFDLRGTNDSNQCTGGGS